MDWLKELVRWIQAKLKPHRPTAQKLILKSWTNKWGTLYLLNRQTPEAVPYATYRFSPSYQPGSNLLLTLDRFRPIRNPDGSDRPASVGGIRRGTSAPGHPDPSHRLSLARLASKPGHNRVTTTIIWSYPVDFVGFRGHLTVWNKLDGIPGAVLEAKSDGLDNNAIAITAQIAQLFLEQYWDMVNWEQAINDYAARLGVNHEILLRF